MESYDFFHKGLITEVCGPNGGGKTAFTLQELSKQMSKSNLKIAWIEETLSIYPSALVQSKLELCRFLFVEAGEFSIWAAHQALQSQLFFTVILSRSQKLNTVELRRLQLAVKNSPSALVLLSETSLAESLWPISTQVYVENFQAKVLKAKGHYNEGRLYQIAAQ